MGREKQQNLSTAINNALCMKFFKSMKKEVTYFDVKLGIKDKRCVANAYNLTNNCEEELNREDIRELRTGGVLSTSEIKNLHNYDKLGARLFLCGIDYYSKK